MSSSAFILVLLSVYNDANAKFGREKFLYSRIGHKYICGCILCKNSTLDLFVLF